MDKRKKQIVFVEGFPTIMVYKIAKEFKKKGYETISIRLLESKGLSKEFYKEAFDEIISFDLNFFKMTFAQFIPILFSLIKKLIWIGKIFLYCLRLSPYIIICRATPSWPCALLLRLFKRTPIIYFPYDIRSVIYSTRELAIKDRGSSDFEIESERFCFENADGIIYKSDPEVLKHIEGRIFKKINFQKLQLNFLPYCSGEFIISLNKNKLSKKDKEFHLVSAISIGSVDPYQGGFYFKIAEQIIKEKIHFHVYHKPNTLSKKELMDSLRKSFGSLVNSKYFHLHKPLEPKDLIKDLSKYDYGLWFTDVTSPNFKQNMEARFATGNKLASYLEAGIPSLYNVEFDYLDRLYEEYGLSLPFDFRKIPKLNNFLKRQNYKRLETNVLKAREDLNMNNHFLRFEEFVETVVRTKKEKRRTKKL